MICKQCGNELSPDAKFCGVCGAPNEAAAQPQPEYAQPDQNQFAQPQYSQPQYEQPQQYSQPQQYTQPQYTQPQQYSQQYAQPAYNAGVAAEDPVERSISKSALVFGILAISFAFIPYINFLGIIFGAIALAKAKKYTASGYVLTGRAKTGKILGMVGLIAGIICTLFWLIIIIAGIVAATSYSNYYYYY